MPNRQTVQNRQQERRKEALQVALEEAVYQELIWLRRQVIGKLNRSQLQKADWKDNLLKDYADHASIWTIFQKRLHDSMMAAISLHGIDILQAEINAHLERGVEPFTYDYDYWLESYSDSLALMVTKVSDTTQKYIGDRITRWFQTPGETVQTVVNDLQTMFEPYRAQAIAQTEITRMDSSMQTGLAETLGIETWAWATRRDSLVCQRKLVGPDGNIYNGCRELHGRIFNMSDKMPPDGSHISCRCGAKILRKPLEKADWAEDKHPRAKDGRFGAKEGGAEKPKTVAGALRVKAAENKNAAPEVKAQKITALARKHFWDSFTDRILPLLNDEYSESKYAELAYGLRNSKDPKDAFNKLVKYVKPYANDRKEFNRTLMSIRNRFYQKLHGAHLMEKPVKVKTEEKPAEKPKIKFVEAKNYQEANDFATKVLGFPNADYKGLDIKISNEWNKGLAEALDEYPAIIKEMGMTGTTQSRYKAEMEHYKAKIIGKRKALYDSFGYDDARSNEIATSEARRLVKKTPSSTWAYSITTLGISNLSQYDGIFINSKFKSEVLNQELSYCVSNGYHPIGCDTIKSIVDHELGHRLNDLLNIGINPKFVDYYLEHEKNIDTELSKYAHKNRAEFIAEAWSEYRNNPEPRQIAKYVGEFIVKAYKEKYP